MNIGLKLMQFFQVNFAFTASCIRNVFWSEHIWLSKLVFYLILSLSVFTIKATNQRKALCEASKRLIFIEILQTIYTETTYFLHIIKKPFLLPTNLCFVLAHFFLDPGLPPRLCSYYFLYVLSKALHLLYGPRNGTFLLRFLIYVTVSENESVVHFLSKILFLPWKNSVFPSLFTLTLVSTLFHILVI